MTVEMKPLGNACNISCTYCYQKFMREDEKVGQYNIPLMLKTADNALVGAKEPSFSMFGGEPLLIPINDLEKFFKHGFEKYGRNGIQTNGTLITESHISLFLKYNVSVGISIDGPNSLNDARRIGNIENTRRSTRKTEENISKLLSSNIVPSLIVTLHRINYSQLGVFLNWIKYLEEKEIKYINFHFMENDDADNLKLSEEELIDFVLRILSLNSTIRFRMFDDIQKLLLYHGKELEGISCIWNGCDPYTTPAVQGVKGDGSLGNCGRTNKTGVDYLKADIHGKERVQGLYLTPQTMGGCNGCRFFYACKGHCPGEGIGNDWRNRTEHCETIKAIFTEFEKRIEKIGRIPISKNEELRKKLELEVLGPEFNNNEHNDVAHGDIFEFEVPVKSYDEPHVGGHIDIAGVETYE